MAKSKAVRLSESAHKNLKAQKKDGETMSEAVERLSKCGCGVKGK